MELNEKLLKLRKEKGLSQEEFADSLGVTRQTVSKWETKESKPDIDKIEAICRLYNISASKLLFNEGEPEEGKNKTQTLENNKKKTALVLSVSIFMYFLSVCFIIVASSMKVFSDEVMVSIFLLICAIPTCLIVYHFVSNSKEKEKKIVNKKVKKIDDIVALIFTVLYLGISFLTHAWHITWLIWLIYAIAQEIIKLIFEGDKDE